MTKKVLPNPIVFGPKKPQLRLRLSGDTQYVYSISNYNLFTSEKDLSSDGTYQLRPLFAGGKSWFEYLDFPVFPSCSNPCQDLLCPMLMEKDQVTFGESGQAKLQPTVYNLTLRSRPEFEKCPVISALLECTTTPAELKFARAYYDWAIAGVEIQPNLTVLEVTKSGFRWNHSELVTRYGKVVSEWQRRQLNLKTWNPPSLALHAAIANSLEAPALIPQVWLNWTYDPTLSPEDEEKDLGNMPKRVDFVFVDKGELHVVEIDDPSHYAQYDETKHRHEVDERQYTKNLRTERALRARGFHIHRFSNFEILNATEGDLYGLISDMLSIDLHTLGNPPQIPRDP